MSRGAPRTRAVGHYRAAGMPYSSSGHLSHSSGMDQKRPRCRTDSGDTAEASAPRAPQVWDPEVVGGIPSPSGLVAGSL